MPGQLADVAVWDTDLLACAPDAILAARCDLAILGGRVAFERRPEGTPPG